MIPIGAAARSSRCQEALPASFALGLLHVEGAIAAWYLVAWHGASPSIAVRHDIFGICAVGLVLFTMIRDRYDPPTERWSACLVAGVARALVPVVVALAGRANHGVFDGVEIGALELYCCGLLFGVRLRGDISSPIPDLIAAAGFALAAGSACAIPVVLGLVVLAHAVTRGRCDWVRT